ncbi:DUF481 domain-containing protein [Mucilaginibacter sp. 14171R-50]|uniref:DUF481 domain-containing protein n=1 Tax=Mucilaginibacter sp. 14171R-50 TaxID=2703789 RepID=UPI00138B9EA0|nr:DUF481 domain-containing protein [Mucilaginibacter sp. 14171R-50]QHS57033.1 DUF481 domain-containing protein [Mucilaginibacter sp. 14171R-50]
MTKIATCIKLLILTAAITCFFESTYAQFNDSTHYHTAFQSSGSINKTNDGAAYLLNNAFRFNIKKKDISLNFSNNWIYGKQNGNLSNNDFSTALDFNLYKGIPHFFYWGLVNYNTSYSLKINNQLLAGAGIAYSLFDSANTYLNISDGVLFDSSDLMLANNKRDVYQTYRNSLRLQFRFNIKDRVVIDGSNFLQNSMQQQSDYIIRSTTSLSFKLQKWLSLTTSLNYNRVNRTNSENLLFTYGVTAEKWF